MVGIVFQLCAVADPVSEAKAPSTMGMLNMDRMATGSRAISWTRAQLW